MADDPLGEIVADMERVNGPADPAAMQAAEQFLTGLVANPNRTRLDKPPPPIDVMREMWDVSLYGA